MSDASKTLPHYTIYVPNPTTTITQALATAARAKRTSMSNRPSGKGMGQHGKSSSNISQFLAKLWRLVNDEETNEYISWNEDGHSFTVRDQSKFSRELLPKYFKHHNFSSFVRQLNMYGFRKILNTEHGGLRCVRDDWQFSNKNFSRDRPELLELVRRKPSQGNPIAHGATKTDYNLPAQLTKVLEEVNNIKDDNEDLKYSFQKLKTENKYLYNQVEDLNVKNNNQGVIIQKIIKFLWSLVSRQNVLGYKRKRQMITHDSNGVPIEGGGEEVPQNLDMEGAPWNTPGSEQQPGPGSPSNISDQVNKQQSNLHSIQNLLQSSNFPFDAAFVNDLFEYSTEYVTPNLSPCPSPNLTSPNGSPGPSGAGSFAVQVEQYNEHDNVSPVHLTSPTYIQHPVSPRPGGPRVSPVPSPHLSPRCSPHISPVSSPHRAPAHLSPHRVSPHMSPAHMSPHSPHSPHQQPLMPQQGSPYQQQLSPGYHTPPPQQHMSPHHSPYLTPPRQQQVQQQSPRQSPHGSPHQQHSPHHQGLQPVPGLVPNNNYPQQGQFPPDIKLSPQHFSQMKQQAAQQQYEQTEHIVKRDKLSSYEQYLNPVWDEEEDEEEQKIDPSSFFRGNPT